MEDRKGGMPFAMVAVAILLLSSAYGAAIASVERTEDDTVSMVSDIMSASDAISDTGRFIEAGMGRIINTITTDAQGGSLLDRMDSFDSRLEDWLGSSFPLSDGGTTVCVEEHDVSLYVASMRGATDGISPSFLKAEGTFGLRYDNRFGSYERTIHVSADGTSGLPFVVESMTRFELSTSGCTSALTDLMVHQLSSTAQMRVLNGYGSVSEFGETGTLSIITEEDVRQSLRSSVAILEELCFRTNGSYDISVGRIDAAEMLASNDGYITLDMSYIMSQGLMAAGDQIVMRWCDLMWGSELLDMMDSGLDGIKALIRSVQGLFTGEDTDSAVRYIRSAMGSAGYEEADYRYLESPSVTVRVGGDVAMKDDWYGFDEDVLYIEPFDIVIGMDTVDILGWEGWDGFKGRFEAGRNDLRESVRTAVHSAAIECVSGYGQVKVKVDPYDDRTLLDSLSEALDDVFSEGLAHLNEDLDRIIDTSKVPDPFYQTVCGEFSKNGDMIYDVDEGYALMVAGIREDVTAHLRSQGMMDIGGYALDAMMGSILFSDEMSRMMESYRDSAQARSEMICDVLSQVTKDNDTMVKKAMRYVMGMSLESDTVRDIMEGSAKGMISDMVSYHRMNTVSDIIELSEEDGFILTDENGRTKTESFVLWDGIDAHVRVIGPRDNKDRCIHNVDSDFIILSPYTTVFKVMIDGTLDYTVMSSDAVMERLGWADCCSSGTVDIDTEFDVPVVSGWALCGVDYTVSKHITDILWEQYKRIIGPLVEPLSDLFMMLMEVYRQCRDALYEITAYLEGVIMELYARIMGPLERLQEMLEDSMLQMLAGVVTGFDIGLGSQSVTLGYMGMTLTLETRLATLTGSTKSLFKVTLNKSIDDIDITASIDVKQHITKGIMVKGDGEVKGDGWRVKLTVDPFMRFSKKLLRISGTVRDVDFSAAIPEIVQYDEIEMKVSDIPGVGEMLSNIPLPIPDVKGSLDMGIFLRYCMPFQAALVINEFESNPPGTDRGNEWAEIYNGTMGTIDLTGYVLTPGSDESKSIVLSGTIPPLGKKVFTFDKQSLNNSSGKKKGECLTLYDPEGEEVDSTPWKTDTGNDDRTWQRSTDGGKTWQLAKGTKGKSNGSRLGMDSYTKTFIVDSLLEAGERALYEMGNHLRSVDDIEMFLKRMVALFIENVIEKISDVIIGAGVFISMELTDYAGTLHTGLRVSLEMDSELVSDGIRWLLSQIDLLSDYVTAPRSTDPADILCDDVFLRTVVYYSTSAPKVLAKDTEIEVMMGISSSVNISGLCTLFGKERGTWKTEIGLVILDCPFELMPKKMRETDGKKGDLWLLRMTFEKAV